MLGLRLCSRAPPSCGERGPLFIAVHRPLTVAASPVAEHRLQTRRLSNCGSQAQLLRGMWDPPRPGLEPVSPSLAGRLSTTAPPGKPLSSVFLKRQCTIYVEAERSKVRRGSVAVCCGWSWTNKPTNEHKGIERRENIGRFISETPSRKQMAP